MSTQRKTARQKKKPELQATLRRDWRTTGGEEINRRRIRAQKNL